MVVNELRGEKIDIVPYSEDLPDFVAKALSPAKVKEVIISADGTQADVIVPDHQLSLAIGKEGQNARLAARLTGVRIDIRGETQLPHGMEEEADYEEGEWVQNEAGTMEFHGADGSVISADAFSEDAPVAEAPAEADATVEGDSAEMVTTSTENEEGGDETSS
jgi:N utilization substance protein A